jgi:flagellar biosynthesis/type III secretory pathway chaperone
MLGHGDDAAGVNGLLAWCDPAGSLAQMYTLCAEAAARCRDQNDRNGALVMARLNRVNSMLGMLNISGNDARTYGNPKPHAQGRDRAGRLVAVTA